LIRAVRNGDDHTTRQLAMMLCLREKGKTATVRSLAAELNVIRPVVSRGIDRLVEDRYVERLPDPEDRRSVLMRLTPAGQSYVESFLAVSVTA
jgi:DNA-binding MarR family transcriptional regulator